MFFVICYDNVSILDQLCFKDKDEALLYGQMLFNSGDYQRVKVFNSDMSLLVEF